MRSRISQVFIGRKNLGPLVGDSILKIDFTNRILDDNVPKKCF